MPKGTEYQKYYNLEQSLVTIQGNLEVALRQYEEEFEVKSASFSGGRFEELIGDDRSPYLVNMIKSIEDPSQERYIIISLIQDFNLVILDDYHQKYRTGNKFGVAVTDVALAVQFEGKNFRNMDYFLSMIKVEYVKKRLQYC